MATPETNDTNNGNTPSCAAETNWTVAFGSLTNTVAYESSLSPINDQFSDSTAAKSPLVLCSTSPDHSTPCEITITFEQKHEVQQVYVRSTARVYEIYYTSELNSSNEYLATVRCGIATRDEQVLRTSAEIVKELPAEAKHRSSSSSSSNLAASEDDWVEVKMVDSPVMGNESSYLSPNFNTSQGRRRLELQDLYEATAEMTDATPCLSITLRFLSLQYKGSVSIDEVYVFADPIDEAGLDDNAGQMQNSAGNSLMAMLMPTLMQLSKSSVGPAQDKHGTDRMSTESSKIIEPKPCYPTDAGNKVQQEGTSSSSYQQNVQLQDTVTPNATQSQPEIPPQVSDAERKPNISHNHIEGVLNQLVSRVSRIEDLFLRFEDCMLKPIRSIDDRLQRVEQQLEVLMKKTQYSGFLSCTRISAPEFSCSESETNSLYNCGCVDPGCAACEVNENDSFTAMSSTHSDDTPVSVNMTKSHPSLVVTAPEFQNCDEEEEEEEEEEEIVVEPVKDSPKENQKHAMSIDDALASALAGFLSSTSIQSPRYLKTLEVKAPDFPNDDGNNNDENDTASPKGPYERFTDPSNGFSEPEGMEQQRSSFSSLSNLCSQDSNENVTRSLKNNNCGETEEEEVMEQLQQISGEQYSPLETCYGLAAPVMHGMAGTSSNQLTDDTSIGEVTDGTGSIDVIEILEKANSVVEQCCGYQTDDNSDTTKEGTVLIESTSCAEIPEEGSDEGILQNAVEFSDSAAQVDFKTPILEVKFTSQENLNSNSPLEALLAGIPGWSVEEVHSGKESAEDDSQIDFRSDLIPIEGCESTSSATDNLNFVDTNYYNLTLLPLNAEAAAHTRNE